MTRCGLPHSDIPGSKLVCSSPGLIAACHVLHRLLAPRHSPYTLSSLTIRNSKLTLTNCLHVSWSATVPCVNTACVCGRKKLPFAEYSVVKERSLDGGQAPKPPSSRTRGAPMPRSVRSLGVFFATRVTNLFTSAAGWVRHTGGAHCQP